jgi:hypothetical protein
MSRWWLALQVAVSVAILSAAASAATDARHVRWYMASGAMADIPLNEAFLSVPSRRRAITGTYACCNFWMVNASTGDLIGDTAGNYSDRFMPFLKRNMTVHAHGMLNELALKSGAAMNAIPALAEFVKNNGIQGVLADYEPLDVTMEHAQLFAKWLEAAAAAVHAIPVQPGEPRKEVGVDIADWSIIGPDFWSLYNASSLDFMATMTPTYGETARDWPYLASLVRGISPEHRIDVGVASTLQPSGPAGGRCEGAPFNSTFRNWSICNTTVTVGGNPYTSKDPNCPWNASSLRSMLDYAASSGIAHASVWRSDIDEECHNGTAPFMYKVLGDWIEASIPPPPPQPQIRRQVKVSFNSLSQVGQRWDNGQWGKLDDQGKEIPGSCPGKTCTRDTPGVTLIASPRESPVLLALGTKVVLCTANGTVQTSSDGGRSWQRYADRSVSSRLEF